MIVHCPKCDEELELPEDAIGAKVQCCACEAKFFADETVVPDEFKAAALRVKAEGGDVAAQCTLGILYQSGQYVTQDGVWALVWLGMAMKNGSKLAKYYIGECCAKGIGCEKNIAEAIAWYQSAAEDGITGAQNRLGECYYKGEGVEKNYAEAVKWFKRAAEAGHVFAKNSLARCYLEGQGCQEDKVKAFQLFNETAAKGNSTGEFYVGKCYDYGYGVEQNLKVAIEWYRKAAAKLDRDAQERLGICYIDGRGVAQNLPVGLKMLEDLMLLDDASNMYRIGLIYYQGEGVPRDYKKAADWFRKAAAFDNVAAQCQLAECYANGHGVSQSDGLAVSYYKKAALSDSPEEALTALVPYFQEGRGVTAADCTWFVELLQHLAIQSKNITAMRILGTFYFNGSLGVTRDYGKAAKLFAGAEAGGDRVARQWLGLCLYHGLGVAVNYERAAEFLIRSFRFANTTKKDVEFYCLIGICLDEGKGVAQNCEEAVKWFRKAAARGHAEAQYRLAKCFFEGRGVWLDEIVGMVWLKKAADNGCKEAQLELQRRHAEANVRRTGRMTIPALNTSAAVEQQEEKRKTIRIRMPKERATQEMAPRQSTSTPAGTSSASPSSSMAKGNGRQPKIPSLRTAVNKFIERASEDNLAVVLYAFLSCCRNDEKVYLVPARPNSGNGINPVARKYMVAESESGKLLAVSPSRAGTAKIDILAEDALKLVLESGLAGMLLFTRNGGCPIPRDLIAHVLKEGSL